MASKKIVRFYEPVKLNQNDEIQTISPQFWTSLFKKLEKLSHHDRTHPYSGTDYYGEAKLGMKPAVRYLYAGRLRDRDDWPDSFEPTSGAVTPLNIAGRLLEPTTIVPFGQNNFVAIMSPRIGGIRPSALESWLTDACGLTLTGDRVELRPLIDQGLAAKLNQRAVGATKLSVRFPAGTTLPDAITDDGDADAGMRAAAASATAEMSAEVTLSLGRSRGSSQARERILRAARWVADHAYADKATVSMLLPETRADGEETLRTESHNLIKDRVSYRVPLESLDGQPPSEESVLRAIQEAIAAYRREH